MKRIGITYEQRTCAICEKLFQAMPSEAKQSCSDDCRHALMSMRQRGMLKHGRRKDLFIKALNRKDKITSQHRMTIFTGGYDQGENFAVVCNEGELL